jgi:hypothetical protein
MTNFEQIPNEIVTFLMVMLLEANFAGFINFAKTSKRMLELCKTVWMANMKQLHIRGWTPTIPYTPYPHKIGKLYINGSLFPRLTKLFNGPAHSHVTRPPLEFLQFIASFLSLSPNLESIVLEQNIDIPADCNGVHQLVQSLVFYVSHFGIDKIKNFELRMTPTPGFPSRLIVTDFNRFVNLCAPGMTLKLTDFSVLSRVREIPLMVSVETLWVAYSNKVQFQSDDFRRIWRLLPNLRTANIGYKWHGVFPAMATRVAARLMLMVMPFLSVCANRPHPTQLTVYVQELQQGVLNPNNIFEIWAFGSGPNGEFQREGQTNIVMRENNASVRLVCCRRLVIADRFNQPYLNVTL